LEIYSNVSTVIHNSTRAGGNVSHIGSYMSCYI